MSVSTILAFISKDNFKFLYIGIIAISVIGLAFAYYVEYGLGIEPCPLCVYQRFPYLYLLKLSITGLIIKKISKYILFSIIATLLIACTIASYHTGIEHGWFQPSALCANILHVPKHFSISQIKQILYDAPVATCTKPAFKIFTISMTEWNLLLNFTILIIVITSYFFIKYQLKNAKTIL